LSSQARAPDASRRSVRRTVGGDDLLASRWRRGLECTGRRRHQQVRWPRRGLSGPSFRSRRGEHNCGGPPRDSVDIVRFSESDSACRDAGRGGHVSKWPHPPASLRLGRRRCGCSKWIDGVSLRHRLDRSSTGSSLQPTGIVAEPRRSMSGLAVQRDDARQDESTIPSYPVLRNRSRTDALRDGLSRFEATGRRRQLDQLAVAPITHARMASAWSRNRLAVYWKHHDDASRGDDRQLSKSRNGRRRRVTLGSVGGPETVCRWAGSRRFVRRVTVSNRFEVQGSRPRYRLRCASHRGMTGDQTEIPLLTTSHSRAHARSMRPRLLHDREPAGSPAHAW